MTSARQLAAIMFTDISGFSAMMQKDETYAKAVLRRQRKVLSQYHDQFDGKILQYIGDGTLSIFNSAVSAVECAVAMQQELVKALHVPLRIGIHSGDITYDETGAFGDGVNVCSRIENLCIPGAVYISEKVYDDIKNHSWLTAMPLGAFRLRNIHSDLNLYAVTSKGLIVPSPDDLEALPEYELDDPEQQVTGGKKRKFVAALLAFFLGIFGVHRFYLGQRTKGIIYLISFVIAMVITVEGDIPIIGLLGILAFIDSILLLSMPQKDFDQKYNQSKVRRKKRIPRHIPAKPKPSVVRKRISQTDVLMKKAQQAITKGRYKEGIEMLDDILDDDENNAEAHFYLAICFSMLKDDKDAFAHLSLAVQNGFNDYSRIARDIHLHHLRSQPEYQAFVDNGYRYVEGLPQPKKDLLQDDTFDPLILDKIESLGERLEKGELTQQEFEMEKKKILGNE